MPKMRLRGGSRINARFGRNLQIVKTTTLMALTNDLLRQEVLKKIVVRKKSDQAV